MTDEQFQKLMDRWDVLVADELDARVAPVVIDEARQCAIAATVVDTDDLIVRGDRFEDGLDAFKEGIEHVLLVEHRHDDGNYDIAVAAPALHLFWR